jgi:hypothetical protein
MSKDRVVLTGYQALDMLPNDGEIDSKIHVYRCCETGVMVGFNLDRDCVVDKIRDNHCEIGGDMCRELGHGLVIKDGCEFMFVECRKGFDYGAFEKKVIEENANEVGRKRKKTKVRTDSVAVFTGLGNLVPNEMVCRTNAPLTPSKEMVLWIAGQQFPCAIASDGSIRAVTSASLWTEWDRLQKIGVGYLENLGSSFERMYPHSSYTFELQVDRDVMIAKVKDDTGEIELCTAETRGRGLEVAFREIVEKLCDKFSVK